MITASQRIGNVCHGTKSLRRYPLRGRVIWGSGGSKRQL